MRMALAGVVTLAISMTTASWPKSEIMPAAPASGWRPCCRHTPSSLTRPAGTTTFLHRDEQATHAQRQLHELIARLLADGAAAGDLRDDNAPGELASYWLHALTAASRLPSQPPSAGSSRSP